MKYNLAPKRGAASTRLGLDLNDRSCWMIYIRASRDGRGEDDVSQYAMLSDEDAKTTILVRGMRAKHGHGT